MRCFVTGGTGFLGVHLIRELLSAGHDVVALVRNPDRGAVLEQSATGAEGQVECVVGDITESNDLAAAMRGADVVFHLAAWYRIGAPPAAARRAEAINVEGTRRVLEAMATAGVPKGVYTSTLAIHSDTGGQRVDENYQHVGPFLSTYERTKWRAHHEIALPMIKAGLPLVVTLPGLVYGPGDTSSFRRMLRRWLRGKLPLLPSAPRYSWSHVEDIARGHRLAWERGRLGESYILAGEDCGLAEAFDRMAAWAQIPAPRRRWGPGRMRFAAAFLQAFAWAGLPEHFQPETLRVAAQATYLGDDRKARRELGFDPRPLDEGLAATLQVEMQDLGIPFPV